MKIALISDIHGNLTALTAVLQDIEQQKADKIICLGDVATLGPQPREVLQKLRDMDCICIRGNHDEALLNIHAIPDYHIPKTLVSTVHWCLENLQQEDLLYLSQFKFSYEFNWDKEFTLFCCHGSPRSTTDIILSTTPTSECTQMLGDLKGTHMAGGHTHIQMLRQHNGRVLLNPGSVGSVFPRFFLAGEVPSLQPWAEYSILNMENGIFNIDMRKIPFNIPALKQIVAKSDIPIKEWWLRQFD